MIFKKDKQTPEEYFYEINCSECKNTITLNSDEINNKRYICPDCNKEIIIVGNESIKKVKKGPTGLGGLLFLVIIGLFFYLFNFIREAFTYLLLLDSNLSEETIYFGIIKNLLLAIFLFIIIILFFLKNKSVPLLIILFLIISLILSVIEDNIIKSSYSYFSGLHFLVNLLLFMSFLLGCRYFFYSKRVKNTFVN